MGVAGSRVGVGGQGGLGVPPTARVFKTGFFFTTSFPPF